MNFINKYKLLIILTVIVTGLLIFRDSSLLEIMSERNLLKLTDGNFTKIIYYSFIFGALVCRWSLLLDENFNFLKKRKKENNTL